jgi:hypothetical protein
VMRRHGEERRVGRWLWRRVRSGWSWRVVMVQ